MFLPKKVKILPKKVFPFSYLPPNLTLPSALAPLQLPFFDFSLIGGKKSM
jgi:hypothetical protein